MGNMRRFKRLDVRPLLERGEEPLTEIRCQLGALAEGEGLTVVAPFLPSPLIELLRSEGYTSRFDRGEGGAWVVHFLKETP